MVKSASKNKKPKKLTLKKQLVFLCACCAVVLLLFLSAFNLSPRLDGKRVLGSRIEAGREEALLLATEKEYWEEFLSSRPGYLPGLLALAEIYIEMELFDKALNALDLAWKINPNSDEVKTLKEKLSD